MLKRGFIVLFVIVLLSLISASYNVGNLSHNITTEYGPSDYLKGYINMSFKGESINLLFTDSLNNSIKLIDLLNQNDNYNFSCTIQGCEPDYSTINPETAKGFPLYAGVTKDLGFRIQDNIEDIISVKFTLSSNAPNSCNNQLKVDLFLDDILDFGNNKSSSETCEDKNYGCFNSSKSKEEYILYNSIYCQEIELPEAPGFRVGAWVKRINAGAANLRMGIYQGSSEKASCVIANAPSTVGQEKEIYCDLDYSLTSPSDHYVCILSDVANVFNIRGNVDPDSLCGSDNPPGTGTPEAAYDLFVQKKKFGTMSSLVVDNTLPDGSSAPVKFKNYIVDKYGGLDCIAGCVIPLRLISHANQTIIIKNIELIYKKPGSTVPNSYLYDLIEGNSTLKSEFGKIFLDSAGFKLHSSYGTKDYSLYFNGHEIFEEEILIEKIPIINGLSPLSSALAYPTKFVLDVDAAAGANLSSYKWVVDSVTKTTTSNELVYTFNNVGTHNITVTVYDTNNKSASKDFQVEVFTSDKKIKQEIEAIKSNLGRVKSEIQEFPAFYQESIEGILGMELIEQSILDIEKDFAIASTDDEYVKIMNDLSQISMPASVTISSEANSLPYIPSRSNVNLDILTSITGEDYDLDEEQEYLDGVISWNLENIDSKITFKEISATQNGITNPLINVFEFEINEKGVWEDDPYFIISTLNDLKFDQDYDEQEESTYTYIRMDSNTNKISFVTTEEISFTDIPMFFSPRIEYLPVYHSKPDDPGISKWLIFILIFVFLIIGGIVTYVILQEWYKNKYETHLFKNRNNLFNILNFINAQKRKRVLDKDIKEKLKKAGWRGEQIEYAMKKYYGKRTGMIELPVPKLFGKKKTKSKFPLHKNSQVDRFEKYFKRQGRI